MPIFFNDTATTEIYTLPLHDALPISYVASFGAPTRDDRLYEAISEGRRYPGLEHWLPLFHDHLDTLFDYLPGVPVVLDRKSTRLNSSHANIAYAVFCLKRNTVQVGKE